jgi:hypothetical protein
MTTMEQRADNRRRDWVPMGLTLFLWLCMLPPVFLVIGTWLSVRAVTIAAVALLLVISVAWQALSTGTPWTA